MKKLSAFFILFALSATSYSQCVPDLAPVSPGAYPFSLDEGFLNEFYSDTLTIVYPPDTLFSGITVPFDSFRVDMVNNLPQDLLYLCSNINCAKTAVPGFLTRECLELSGTPTGIPSSDIIEISYTGFLTVFGSPITLPGMIMNAQLPMTDNTAINEGDGDLFSIYPNPSSGHVTLQLPGIIENAQLDILNITGQVVLYYSFSNCNVMEFELPFTPGIYLLELSAGDGSRKIFKVNKI